MATLTVTLNSTTYTLPDPELEGMKITQNKIWSENAGRNANGSFSGTIKAIKAKVELSWPILSKSDAALIKAAASTATATCTLSYPDVDGTKTITGYFNDFTYDVVDFGRWWVKNAKLNIIEV